MIVDLHTHSYYSDGSLSPKSLIKLAEQNAVEMLSITDHDNVDAYHQIKTVQTKIKIIPGIEFSTSWNKIGIHIVGLNVDIQSGYLLNAISYQKKIRLDRAEIIAKKMEKFGLYDAIEKIKLGKNVNQIGRPDFAQLLVAEGIAKDWNQAFKKYLGSGRAGDVKNDWLDFKAVLKVIKLSGGVPVLAHPLYYKLTNSKLKRLIHDFKLYGGEGIEVINGFQNPQKTEYLKGICTDFDLKASIGSDFHAPSKWTKLGCKVSLISGLKTVW